jgi:transposase
VTISHDLKFESLSRLKIFMPPALSIDIKKRIVELRYEGLAMRDIATQMKVSVGGVHKTLRTYEECGEYLDPSKRKTGRPQILDDDDAWYLKSLLESNPTLYLDEIREKLETVRNVSVSMATISCFLRSRDFTWKTVSRKALEGDKMVRACWEAETAQYVDPDYFVFIDESHIDQKTSQRPRGWAPVGLSPIERSTFLKGVRHSILPALSTDGIIALDIFEGSVDKEKFIQFLRDQVVRGFRVYAFIYFSYSASGPTTQPFPGEMEHCRT